MWTPKTREQIEEDFKKRVIYLRGALDGRGMYRASAALEKYKDLHVGTRKDKKTPSFMHQVEAVLFALELNIPIDKHEDLICTILLHDSPEDINASFVEIVKECGEYVAHLVKGLTKEYLGVKMSNEVYYNGLLEDPLLLIAKACDRMHNNSTLVGVFSLEKTIAYRDEGYEFVLPTLKRGRRKFPQYKSVIMILEHIIRGQLKFIDYAIFIGSPISATNEFALTDSATEK